MDPTILAHPTPPPPAPVPAQTPQVPPTPPAEPPPAKRSKWLYIGLAGLLVGGLCCVLGVVAALAAYNLNKKSSPPATLAPVNVLPVTSIPLPTLPPVFDTPLPATQAPANNSGSPASFHDDFSSANSGWWVQSTDNTESSYNSSGFFEMTVKKSDFYLIATSPDSLARPLKNVILQVRVQPGQTNTGDYGVVCRYQDIDNFYMAAIAGDKFYIGKQVAGAWTYLTSPEQQPLPSRSTDAEGYTTIGLSCIDSFFVLEINGLGAAHVTDNEFSFGDPGLVVWGSSSPGAAGLFAQAAFDDFTLTLP